MRDNSLALHSLSILTIMNYIAFFKSYYYIFTFWSKHLTIRFLDDFLMSIASFAISLTFIIYNSCCWLFKLSFRVRFRFTSEFGRASCRERFYFLVVCVSV